MFAYDRSVRSVAFLGLAAVLGGEAPGRAADDAPAGLARVGPSIDEYRARRSAVAVQVREAEEGTIALRAAISRGEPGRRQPPALLVVVVGKGEPGDDARFHQANDFHYLTGVDVPHASSILRPDLGEETLYLPPRNPQLERYNGPTLAAGPDAAERTGFARVAPSSEFLADLFGRWPTPARGVGAGRRRST